MSVSQLPASGPAAAAIPEPPKDKKPRISKRIRSVAELLITGECKTIKAASERIGLAYDYVRQELKKPSVRVFCEQRARETIAAGTMRASARLIELLDAGSEHVSLDATKHMLGIAGIKPATDPQVSVNIDIKAGYVIDLREDSAPVIDAVPELVGNVSEGKQ